MTSSPHPQGEGGGPRAKSKEQRPIYLALLFLVLFLSQDVCADDLNIS